MATTTLERDGLGDRKTATKRSFLEDMGIDPIASSLRTTRSTNLS